MRLALSKPANGPKTCIRHSCVAVADADRCFLSAAGPGRPGRRPGRDPALADRVPDLAAGAPARRPRGRRSLGVGGRALGGQLTPWGVPGLGEPAPGYTPGASPPQGIPAEVLLLSNSPRRVGGTSSRRGQIMSTRTITKLAPQRGL